MRGLPTPEQASPSEGTTSFRPKSLGVSRAGLAVVFDMRLGCFRSVVHRVFVVTASQVSVMRCCVVLPCFVVLSGFFVVSCRVFVMLSCLVMMLCCFA